MFSKPDYATADRFNWPFFLFMSVFHLVSIAAIWTFSWEGFLAGFILYLATGSIGISFAYHRLHTHQSMSVPKWVLYAATWVACHALEGGPIFWTSTHRYHHKKSDKPLDPHSPRDGFFWAHMGWMMFLHPVLGDDAERAKITPDLHKDPVICWMEKYNVLIALSIFPILYAIGYALGGPDKGLSLLIWGGFLRVVVVWHVTWMINSATHKWGYRNYDTYEDSTNNPLIALFSFGEGWHNNHHGDQRSGVFGHRWFEFDYTYVTLIWPLMKLGLVTKLIRPKNANFDKPVIVTESDEPDVIPSSAGMPPLKPVSSV